MIENGNKVKGIFSGKYLGVVQLVSNGFAIIRGPDGVILTLSTLMIEPIPEMVTNKQARVWVV